MLIKIAMDDEDDDNEEYNDDDDDEVMIKTMILHAYIPVNS